MDGNQRAINIDAPIVWRGDLKDVCKANGAA
jgi:hypothetical protein